MKANRQQAAAGRRYWWRWKKVMPERFGEHCEILRPGDNRVTVRFFSDGVVVDAPRQAVRLVHDKEGAA